ncbi:MAG TPA: hypothetical protein VN680_12370 [Burkholderiaceae bacterium]|nr:hypothetical protein [Burkholderiaceae bacterium]
MINILLQTTIKTNADDWGIERFSMLRDFLSESVDSHGRPLFRVTARNRLAVGIPDPILSTLADSDFDELWLFAVDVGDGLTPEDCEGITKFRRRGGGLMVTRDHMDLGSSLCTLGAGIGAAHHFHSTNKDPDRSRHRIDDPYSANILWPNYHSGANGDFQRVFVVGQAHPVLQDPLAPEGLVRFLPAHPHEGSVCAPPEDPSARVILEGHSAISRVRFNLAVAFEASDAGGPVIAQSTFHHFCDYNWDVERGAPSFVSEAPGEGIRTHPDALRSTQQYVRNIALWLAGSLPPVQPRQ